MILDLKLGDFKFLGIKLELIINSKIDLFLLRILCKVLIIVWIKNLRVKLKWKKKKISQKNNCKIKFNKKKKIKKNKKIIKIVKIKIVKMKKIIIIITIIMLNIIEFILLRIIIYWKRKMW